MGDSNLISLSTSIVKSHSAFIQWQPTTLSGQSFLLLTDRALLAQELNQNVQNNGTSSIKRYQVTPSELLNGGSYLFENLVVGEYVAQLIVISSGVISKSNALPITVYNDVPTPVISSIIPGDEKVTFVMEQPSSSIDSVTFVLFSQGINPINVSLPYSTDNRYVLTAANGIKNYVSFEVLVMYIVGDLSSSTETFLIQSSNYPNKITDVTQVFDYQHQKYTVNYTLPSDFSDYSSVTGLKLDIWVTYNNASNLIVDQHKLVDFTLVGLASAQQSVSFSPSDTFTSGETFPVDMPFTIKLAMVNNYGVGVYSDTMSAILPQTFSADQAIIQNTVYSTSPDFSVNVTTNPVDTDYELKIRLVVTDVANVTNKITIADYKGEIVTGLLNGKTYDSVISAYLVYKADSSIVFGPSDASELRNHRFIKYALATAPIVSVDYLTSSSDNLTRFMWQDVNLGGLPLEHYKVRVTNGASPDSVLNVTSTITVDSVVYNYVDVERSLGQTYNCTIQAITKYVLSGSQQNNVLINGAVSIPTIFAPWKKPLTPVLVSRKPGDKTSTISISLPDLKGGILNKFLVKVNASGYSEKTFTYDSITQNYTAVFDVLNNDVDNSIKIKVETMNSNDSSLTALTSEVLTVTTFPFSMPVPPNVSLVPEEGYVRLTTRILETVNGDEIVTKIYYKENSSVGSYTESTQVWVPIAVTGGAQYHYSDIIGLTNGTLYDFKIKLVLHNTESNTDYESAYSNVQNSTPIHHTTAPGMVIVRENQQLIVTLTKSDENFINEVPAGSSATTFKYSASAYDKLSNGTKGSLLQTLSSDVNTLTPVVLTFAGEVDYIIEAYYQMYNSEVESYYRSDNATNVEAVYDSAIAPELTGVEGNGTVALGWNNLNMIGLTMKGSQLQINGGAWVDIVPTSSIVHANSSSNTPSYTKYDYDVTTTNGDINKFVVRFVIKNPAYINGGVNANSDDVVYSANSNEVTKQSYSSPPAPVISYTTADNGDVTLVLTNNNYGGLPFVKYETTEADKNSPTKIGNTVTVSPSAVGQRVFGSCKTIVDNAVNGGSLISSLPALYDIYAYSKLLPVDLLKLIVDSSGQEVGDRNEYKLDFDFDPENNIKLGGRNLSGFKAQLKVKGAANSTMVSVTPVLVNGTGHYKFGFTQLLEQVYELIIETSAYNSNTGSNNVVVTEIFEFSPSSLPVMKGLTSVGNDTTVTMSWTAPNLFNGTFVKYQVTKASDDSAWVDITNINTQTYTFTGLLNGQQYTLRARVVTNKGTGEIVSTTMTPYAPAEAPVVTFEVVNGTVVLSWVQAGNNSSEYKGLNLDKFQVQVANNDWVDVAKKSTGNVITYTAVGLTNGQSLLYKVRSITSDVYHANVLGSTWQQDITSFVVPNHVINLRINAYNGYMDVMFNAPANNNFNITNVFRYAIADTSADLAGLNESLRSGIVSGDVLDIRSRGDVPFVLGVWTAFVDPNHTSNLVFSTSVVINAVNTDVPVIYDLESTNTNMGEITLSWKDQGFISGVSKYDVYFFNENGSREMIASDQGVLSYVKTGLTNGVEYRFGVSKDGVSDIFQILVTPLSVPVINSVSKDSSNLLSVAFSKGGDSKVSIMVIANNTTTGALQFFDAITTEDTYSVNVGENDKFIVIVRNDYSYVRSIYPSQ